MSRISKEERCASQLKAFADPVRLRILKCLQAGPLTVSDVADLVELDLANVSHHLRALKHGGLAETRREGKYIYYSLNPDIHTRRGRSGESAFDLGCCRFVLPGDSDES